MTVPELNIGLVGHVDHGKTTLTEALSGKWTDEHSEELQKGITIQIGYADVTYYKKEGKYNVEGEGEKQRSMSLVDAPGHETLMANVLSGTSIMDGALLLVAADEKVPQPQTREHLAALDTVGVENIVIVQNKIDRVSEQEAKQNYEQIKEFTEGTVAEDAPVVPISAQFSANIDMLLEAVEEEIPTPERDREANPRMQIVRSFDINRPGTEAEEVKGGVVGGSLTQGKIREGQEVEIAPGTESNGEWSTVTTEVKKIYHGREEVEEATPGGLMSIQTGLDPSLTKSDNMSDNVLGRKDSLPEPVTRISLKTNLIDTISVRDGDKEVDPIKKKEGLMINAGTAKSAGIVTQAGDTVVLDLKIPVCVEEGDQIAISRQIESRWRLVGYGKVTTEA
jgi:translation initiation factor 2 subunit 3